MFDKPAAAGLGRREAPIRATRGRKQPKAVFVNPTRIEAR
jgi:hypothetical protein